MAYRMLATLSVSVLPALVVAQSSAASPPSAYAVPGVFPTSVYGAYYNDPTATTAEPQPIITDPVTVSISHSVRILAEFVLTCYLSMKSIRIG